MCLVMMTYFAGFIFGMYVILQIIKQASGVIYVATSLCGLFTYIGTPVSVAIGFYHNKAKAENIEKIKYSREDKSIGRDLDGGECGE